ncbi:hypothetical protein MHBO_000946 [Bonamia ostreae]|uniref:DUF423 domain-containing protein n=1 Tax=Bonamia ostreae TaxID=126728 RepID=A0ABV2AHJ0_9EUKA
MFGNKWLKLAGFNGASSLVLASLGAHSLNQKTKNPDFKRLWKKAQYYHSSHAIAMLAVTAMQRLIKPSALFFANSFFLLGTVIFAGGLYYKAYTGNEALWLKAMPYGQVLLLLGWLSLVFA